jgi:hypothetical protein
MAATVINRGSNLHGGIHDHYKIVTLGKAKIFTGNHMRLARFEIVSTRRVLARSMTIILGRPFHEPVAQKYYENDES